MLIRFGQSFAPFADDAGWTQQRLAAMRRRFATGRSVAVERGQWRWGHCAYARRGSRDPTWGDCQRADPVAGRRARSPCSTPRMPTSPSPVLRLLRDCGWEVATEVSFNVRGERGTVDILAFHRANRVTVRHRDQIGRARPSGDARARSTARSASPSGSPGIGGWRVDSVSRLLVFPDDRTARRRVDQHAATFEAVLPSRTAAVRRWLRSPDRKSSPGSYF